MITNDLDLSADIIDVLDIIERVKQLEIECDGLGEDECSELVALRSLLDSLKGMGGDEQWRGDWYPVTLIRDSHFQSYAQELAEDCGLTDKPRGWPYTCIDWDRAARELQGDYSPVQVNGFTYWTR